MGYGDPERHAIIMRYVKLFLHEDSIAWNCILLQYL